MIVAGRCDYALSMRNLQPIVLNRWYSLWKHGSGYYKLKWKLIDEVPIVNLRSRIAFWAADFLWFSFVNRAFFNVAVVWCLLMYLCVVLFPFCLFGLVVAAGGLSNRQREWVSTNNDEPFKVRVTLRERIISWFSGRWQRNWHRKKNLFFISGALNRKFARWKHERNTFYSSCQHTSN